MWPVSILPLPFLNLILSVDNICQGMLYSESSKRACWVCVAFSGNDSKQSVFLLGSPAALLTREYPVSWQHVSEKSELRFVRENLRSDFRNKTFCGC